MPVFNKLYNEAVRDKAAKTLSNKKEQATTPASAKQEVTAENSNDLFKELYNTTVKKKVSSAVSPTSSAESSPTQSQSALPEENTNPVTEKPESKPPKQEPTLRLADQLASQYGYKPVQDMIGVGLPNIQNKIKAAQFKEAKAVNEFAKNPTADNLTKITRNVSEESKKRISNRFYNGNLDETDISEIVKSNPFLINSQSQATLPNNKAVANQVNAKTKNLAQASREINKNAYDYAFKVRDIDDQIHITENAIQNAETDYSGTVFVDPKITSLKPVSTINGLAGVTTEDFLNEQREKLNGLQRQKEFLNTDYTTNVYEPRLQKVTTDIINQIENEKGKDAVNLDPVYLKEQVDTKLRALRDPILMANKGVDPNNKSFFYSPTEMSARLNSGNDDYEVVVDGNGRQRVFKNDDYIDAYDKVYSYFHIQKPVNNAAKESINKLTTQPENKKFSPLVDNQDAINKYFSSDNVQNMEADIRSKADIASTYINNDWQDKISRTPAYQKLSNDAQEKVRLGMMSEDQASMWLNDQLQKSPELKNLNKERLDNLAFMVKTANAERMRFLMQGVKSINPGLSVDKDGNITVEGATNEQSKAFLKKVEGEYTRAAANEIKKIQKQDVESGNRKVSEVINAFGGALGGGGLAASFVLGVRSGWNNMMEGFARYYDLKDLRNYYTGVNTNDVIAQSDFVKNASTFTGLRSLVNPAYYAYNVGQSLPYMAPAIAIGAATGGLGTGGAVIGGLVAGNLEAVQNGWNTYNDLIKTGKSPNGLPITANEAALATAQQMGNEFLPNIVLGQLEFGSLMRGIKSSPALRTTFGRQLLSGAAELAGAALPQGIQEVTQGYGEQIAKAAAQGQQPLDIYDYLQTDDATQNFFGGLAGGAGFGAGGFAKKVGNAYSSYKNWKNILATARGNYSGFNSDVLRSNAIQNEMGGTGAPFRDGLRLRLENEDFVNDAEKAQLQNTLAYSVALNKATNQLRVAKGNFNGMAAAHNVAMAENYKTLSDQLKESNSTLSDIYRQKEKDHKAQAAEILNGNTKGVNYIMSQNGTPVFLNEQDAAALSESGDLQQMVEKGEVINTNIPFESKSQEQAAKLEKERIDLLANTPQSAAWWERLQQQPKEEAILQSDDNGKEDTNGSSVPEGAETTLPFGKYEFIDVDSFSGFESPDAYLRDLESKGVLQIEC